MLIISRITVIVLQLVDERLCSIVYWWCVCLKLLNEVNGDLTKPRAIWLRVLMVTMMLVLIVRSWTLSLDTEIWVWIQVYLPVFTQRNRTGRRYRLRKLLQGIVLHDCGGWVGKSKNCRHVHWEGRLALSAMSRCCHSLGEFLLPQGTVSFSLQALQLIESDLPRLSKIFTPA